MSSGKRIQDAKDVKAKTCKNQLKEMSMLACKREIERETIATAVYKNLEGYHVEEKIEQVCTKIEIKTRISSFNLKERRL